MRVSRPCYDKYHRCPGWAGGGLKYAKADRCPGHGYVRTYGETRMRRLWKWRFHRCDKCGVIVLPYMTRWLDPAWIADRREMRKRYGR